MVSAHYLSARTTTSADATHAVVESGDGSAARDRLPPEDGGVLRHVGGAKAIARDDGGVVDAPDNQ
eukprot:COSAG01_NODE_13174_length_1625_cov_1.295544_4_plen_65_part_01